jgi:hypothetical protein
LYQIFRTTFWFHLQGSTSSWIVWTLKTDPIGFSRNFGNILSINGATAVAQWLRYCATNRKVASSIPANVSGFFIDKKSFRSHHGAGVDSTSNRNECQEYFLGVKAAGA